MALKINEILSSTFAQWLVYKFIRAYSLTFRLEVQNEEEWLEDYLNNKESIILCVHHQQFFPAIRYFQKYKKYNPGCMISRSKDGEFIAGVAKRTGWTAVRGSSSKGGSEALQGMIDHLNAYRLAGHAIDGPRGPFGVVKPGAIRLAHVTNSIIIPLYTGADRAWYAKSWDKFLIPKPFAKVVIRFGEKVNFAPTETSDAFEKQRKDLEDIMAQGSEELTADLQ